jgi:hypothetical protein
MSEEFNFGKSVSETIKKVPGNERKELLEMVFKSYVAKLLEVMLNNSGTAGRLESGMIDEVKKRIIHEFREAPLENSQMSYEMYEDLFDTAIAEILNEAALNHQGEDHADFDLTRQLEIDPRAYIKEGGIYVPPHLKGTL